MGLKILHSADWHLGSPFRSLPEENRASLRAAQAEIPERIAALCAREQCDMVLLAGDLFDTPTPAAETVRQFKAAMQAMNVPVFISPGNHDCCTAESVWMTEQMPENVHVFTGGVEYVDLAVPDCRIYGAGYRSMDCPGLLKNFHAEGTARWCVGVFHADPLNLSSPCCPVTAAQVRESGLDYLALGHIHSASAYRAGETLCAWPGCPMGRGWDETGEKGAYIASLEETASVQFQPLGLPQFYDMTAEIRTDAYGALEAILPPTESRDLYRVTLTGTGSVRTDALQRRFAHLALLELHDGTHADADLWEWAGEDSLRGIFFQMLKEAAEDPQQAQTAILAAELSQKLLRGEEVLLP